VSGLPVIILWEVSSVGFSPQSPSSLPVTHQLPGRRLTPVVGEGKESVVL
jgi:hypothetical protein